MRLCFNISAVEPANLLVEDLHEADASTAALPAGPPGRRTASTQVRLTLCLNKPHAPSYNEQSGSGLVLYITTLCGCEFDAQNKM